MALTREAAAAIVEVVAKDTDSVKAMIPNPAVNEVAKYANPLTSAVLEWTGTAGGVRNFVMIVGGMGPGDAKFDERICLGIAARTVGAIHRGMKYALLPDVRSCSGIHRRHWGVEHEATWVRMRDDGEYVFDWHATLEPRNPMISRAADWMTASGAVHFRLFGGFA